MRTGTVNVAKIIGICNRLRIAPSSQRAAIIRELIAAADEDADPQVATAKNQLALFAMRTSPEKAATIANLREMLKWPEVRNDGRALARIAKTLNSLRYL
jgi:hypothetical protein